MGLGFGLGLGLGLGLGIRLGLDELRPPLAARRRRAARARLFEQLGGARQE